MSNRCTVLSRSQVCQYQGGPEYMSYYEKNNFEIHPSRERGYTTKYP